MMGKSQNIEFDNLVKLFDKNGWKEGYQNLKRLHEYLENRRVFLLAEPASEKQAAKMLPGLLKQDVTLKRLEILARQRGIDIGDLHR